MRTTDVPLNLDCPKGAFHLHAYPIVDETGANFGLSWQIDAV